jgi:hypothetical protein
MKKLGIILFLIAGAAQAQAPVISVPAEVSVKPGRLARVVATTTAGSVQCLNVYEDADLIREYDDTPGTFAFRFLSDTPGRYKLGFYAAGPKGELSQPTFSVVVVQGQKPDPKPDPGPDPKPDPTPPGPTKLFVVIVEASGQAVAQRGQMLSDPALTKRFTEKGHHWRVVDQHVLGVNGQTPADVAPYIAEAKTKTLPQVFLVTPQGRAVFKGDLPRTAAELLALIERHGG